MVGTDLLVKRPSLRQFVKHLLTPPPPSPRPPVTSPPDDVDVALVYHQRTRHFPGRYARALGYMDWDTQPDPFRHFDGSPQLSLPLGEVSEDPRYEQVFFEGGVPSVPLTRESLAQFLYDSVALSAWKEAGEARWALRVNPSSGNLHPTEVYILVGGVPGLSEKPGIYHYHPYHHGLEVRAEVPLEVWTRLVGHLGENTFLVGLTSIPWREAWKYGERSFRYCQHDLGHAAAALSIGAACQGWDLRYWSGPTSEHLSILLGIFDQRGPEAEEAEGLFVVRPGPAPLPPVEVLTPLVETCRETRWQGQARALSQEHHDWPVIPVVARATRRGALPPAAEHRLVNTSLIRGESLLPARRILRQRRSAVDMDGVTGLSASAFFQILLKTTPGQGQVPFDLFPWTPTVHLALFVHRVEGVEPGLYLLVREVSTLPLLREHLRPDFLWTRPEGCPPSLGLWLLQRGDFRSVARSTSCGQNIASDGVFAVAMLAHFEPLIREGGGHVWRQLHWEAGQVGQMLYLEAEASGIRGTGIGCFFDELSHQALGIRDTTFQVIYHFTMGGAVEDKRLRTTSAYPHRGG